MNCCPLSENCKNILKDEPIITAMKIFEILNDLDVIVSHKSFSNARLHLSLLDIMNGGTVIYKLRYF